MSQTWSEFKGNEVRTLKENIAEETEGDRDLGASE